MLKRLQDYFIGHHLRKTDDVFEHARTIMVYRFSLMFLVLFILPVVTDFVLGYNKLLVLHLFDFFAIAIFPFVMRKVEKVDTQLILFFILTTLSSYVIILMANPMKFDIIGLSWIIFFSSLSALLLKGFARVLFTVILPWVPLIYIAGNIRLNGALTIEAIVQTNAGEPPLFLMFVPITLLIYSLWSHTLTIAKARKTITTQKAEIEDKNKDITDSINYARHLQDALLPRIDSIRHALPHTEIYYKPKSIVAGDFYWLEKSGSRTFIAAADCTGHGVPGAMVSVICSGALSRCVREFRLETTNAILDKTRQLVIEAFGNSSESVNDGMDISLLCIDNLTGEVTWSGANNPLWIVSGKSFTAIKGDKQPIGLSLNAVPYTRHTVPVQKGDSLYLFTDGFADQFGGPDGKKFRYKPLIRFFTDHHQLAPVEQIARLDEIFCQWKGDLEQVDDICIIAIKL